MQRNIGVSGPADEFIAGHYRLSSRDPHEVENWFRRQFSADHARTPLGTGPWEYDFRMVGSTRLGMSLTTVAGEYSIRAQVPQPMVIVHFSLDGPVRYRVGRRLLEANRACAVVLLPGHVYSATIGPATIASFFVELPRLQEEIRLSAAGHRQFRPSRCIEVPLSLFSPPDVADEYRSVFRESPTEPDSNRLEHWGRRATAALAKAILLEKDVLDASRAGLTIAEDVAQWIGDHLGQPITVDTLSVVAGVSGRWLQKSFLQRWGQTPLEFVASRRLAAVRTRLVAAPAGAAVTRIALESGFTHLGRFAALYRRAYGELPSDTLARVGRARAMD